MGRINLVLADRDIVHALKKLRILRAADVKSRKSKSLARLKPKYTSDIKTLDLLLTTLVLARKILRALPKSVH